ncbi:MAG: dienelactone hydrolase family protein [Acidobacteriota bacterium]
MRSRTLIWGSVLMLLAAAFLVACGGNGEHDSAEGSADDHVERMAEEHKTDTPEASPAALAQPAGEAEASRVVYANQDGADITGFLARPKGVDDAPAVIVIHEWWGLNTNIEMMALRLAGEGYLALAVDLYGGQVAEDRERARELMMASTEKREVLQDNLRQAYAYLETAGAPKVGSIGWCFGGGWSLQTALLLPDQLDAAVIYYGRVVTEREQLAGLTTPILGHFGSEDQGIPLDGVRTFESLLGELGKTGTLHVYEGADHAFANPSGTRYHAEAASTAWDRTLEFFTKHLATGDGAPSPSA